jgi:hypothetical protein
MRINDITAIEAYFDSLNERTFTVGRLQDVFHARKKDWNLPREMNEENFVQLLLRRTRLIKLTLRSQRYPAILRYTWGPPQPLSLALSIRPSGYFSHGTAMWIHGIGDTSNDIYLNREQSEKTRDPGALTQSAIDRAFRNNQRYSRLVYTYGTDVKITVLNGKNSKQLEVAETKWGFRTMVIRDSGRS